MGDANEAGAAGDFHVDHRQTLQIGHLEDGREFVEMRLAVVEFGAGNGDGFFLQQPLVKIGHSEGRALSCEQEVGSLKERRRRWDQGELDRPVPELRGSRFMVATLYAGR